MSQSTLDRLMGRAPALRLYAKSGGGGGGGGEQNVTTTAQPPDFQLPNLTLLQDEARKYFTGTPPPAFYPNTRVADFQPEQVAGQNQILDYAAGALPGLAGNAIASNQFALGPAMDPASNPYLAASVEAAAQPVVRAYEQITRPGIQQDALGASAYGNTRHGIAEGIAGQGALDAIARNSYESYNQNYQNAADNAIRAQALAPQTLSLGTQPGQLTAAVGDVRQAQDQAFIGDAVDRFNFEQGAPLAHLQDFQGLIGGNFGGTTTSEGSSQPGGSAFGRAVGGALSGASAGLAFASAFPALGVPAGVAAGFGALLGIL